MNPAARALWFIEAHFKQDLSLDDVAKAAGVSRFHLSRVFAIATGCSVGRYIRGRRLTEAARTLAAGAPDILAVALDAGYNSHEAFTRAFRDQFGLTPEQLRAQANLGHIELHAQASLRHIKLTEPIKMDETLWANLEAPRFENGSELLIAGITERCNGESVAGIAAQWQRFIPYIGRIPGQVGCTTYGIISAADPAGDFNYTCGVQISGAAAVPPELGCLRIPENRYAVFTHREHISTIRRTWFTILNKWLPESEYAADNAPEFERYGSEFNPQTGTGAFEIWIPIAPKAVPANHPLQQASASTPTGLF